MKSIIAQVTANNQVLLRYVDRPDCLRSKSAGDLTAEKRTKHLGKHQQEIERIHAMLSHGCEVNMHNNSIVTEEQLCLFKDTTNINLNKNTQKRVNVSAPACDLTAQIECAEITDDNVFISKTSYSELSERKRVLLDIMKKSQHRAKKERNWGKQQSVKRFTRNAKQRILEAGAVVDKKCSKEATYELTLTIPGSGIEVYDVVARWSGWIINRMTQIIRRLEAKGHEIYWFFVWEHQKRGALHSHWCIACPDDSELSRKVCQVLRAKWWELLQELSDREGVDLFKNNGYSKSWRDSPEVWQSNIAVIRKSVAAYFSKYCSKNVDTSKYNRARRDYEKANRQRYPDRFSKVRAITLCPSRYWGSGYQVKRACAQSRVVIRFNIFNRSEGDYIRKTIIDWCNQLSVKVCQVERTFKTVDAKTGFIYARGWETRLWFNPHTFELIIALFKRIHADKSRCMDAVGYLCSMDYF